MSTLQLGELTDKGEEVMSNVEGERLLEEMEKVMAGEPTTMPVVSRNSLAQDREPVLFTSPPREAPVKLTTTQGIARDITRLTWREAEAMGRAIQEKMKDGKDAKTITQAIQDWAWTWQTFKEEEQPK